MPNYSKKIVYLSNEQYQNLVTNQTITVDGNIITYNENDIYVTPQTAPVTDVQVNSTSIVNNGVANIPLATTSTAGVGKISNDYGISITSGIFRIYKATDDQIKLGTNNYRPITPSVIPATVFYGLSKVAGEDLASDTVTLGTYPEKSISAIHQMLDAPISVTGSTPTITAKAGVRYVCGEVSTLSFTPSATGVCDVVFTSGSTPTVLTLPNTVKFPDAFDPTSLDANTVYEINILNGVYGLVSAWT